MYIKLEPDMDSSYCNINRFQTDPMENNLDTLARQINDNKKKNSRDIYNEYRKNATNAHNGILAFNNFQQSQNDKETHINPIIDNSGFYSAQGDYSEYKPNSMSGTLIKDICIDKRNNDIHKSKNILPNINIMPTLPKNTNLQFHDDSTLSVGMTIETPSAPANSSMDESSSDSESLLSSITEDEIEDQLKTKSKYSNSNNKKKNKRHKCIDFDLNSVDSLESLESGESLINHIRFCPKCKTKVMDLIKKHKSDTLKMKKLTQTRIKPQIHYPENFIVQNDVSENEKSKNDINENFKSFTNEYYPEFKEIITICLIGFLVIIILDLMMRHN